MKEFTSAGHLARQGTVVRIIYQFPLKQCAKLIMLLLFLSAFMTGFSQTVTLKAKRLPFQQVLKKVRQQTGYNIFYNQAMLENAAPVTVNAREMPLEEFFRIILVDQPIEVRFSGKTIYFSEKIISPPPSGSGGKKPEKEAEPESFVIIGKVVSGDGKIMPGITVKMLPAKNGAIVGGDGTFVLVSHSNNTRIVFSGVGWKTITLPVSRLRALKPGEMLKTDEEDVQVDASGNYTFRMQPAAITVNEVVVNTGLFTRRKESFTGVTHTIKGDELRRVNKQSLLEGLSILDPSFRIIRDNNLGSDPNQLPKVEFRGTRSAPAPTTPAYSQQLRMQYGQDPNQPLFILDGFEVTLQDVINLDINRVASVVLLKDAASTALYGRRSANGVVVIETIRPVPGKLSVSYTTTGNLAVPDLSGYNMMDAAELFEFQMLSGLYDAPYIDFAVSRYQMRNSRYNEILRGVNTYWPGVPLRNAFSANHNLTAQGGDGSMNYIVGISKKRDNGVMKGSFNENTAGFTTLTYRRNKINITNSLRYTVGKQQGSPYGSFRSYVELPPYYRKYDEQGNLNTSRYLEDIPVDYSSDNGVLNQTHVRRSNPLYNALLPFKNELNTTQLSNTLNLNWDILPSLRLSAGGQFQKDDRTADFFVSPLNTQFDSREASEKGSYNFQRTVSTSYNGNIMLTYNKVFNGKHILNMNARGDLTKSDGNSVSIDGVGFATAAQPLLFLAGTYLPNSRPGGNETNSRSVGFTASANYSYHNRYNLDVSFNTSGSNSFGADQLFRYFYSFGVGWNIGEEDFFVKSDIVSSLRLSANYGLTGNEAGGGFSSRSTYQLDNVSFRNQQAANIVSFGNPNLEWTKTYKFSYSVEGAFFKNKLSFSLSGFADKTDPMVIAMPVAPSTGLDKAPSNIGRLRTVGMELLANYRVINTKNWSWNLGINSPLFLRSEYSGLENKLQGFSKIARDSGLLIRYIDGASPNDLWAVRSLGIDPVTGREIFLDGNGTYTFDFNSNYEVKAGTNRPVLQGSINTQVRYKQLSLAIYCRYVMGEAKFNEALYNKVENISQDNIENNQDKRALYARWKKPGDNASFLGVGYPTLGRSDRFLQKENAFYFESVALNYDFNYLLNRFSKKKPGISRLDLSFNLNEFFRFQLSNLRLERGLDFPFARNASFTLSVGF